jgi:hypothetical protein
LIPLKWIILSFWLTKFSCADQSNNYAQVPFKTKVSRRNCIMDNAMHKFLIYLSIYFYLICFGLSFSPSSEAGVQLRKWFKFPGYGVSARDLKPCAEYLNHCRSCTPASEDGLKESPKYIRQK